MQADLDSAPCGCTFRVDNPQRSDLPFLKKMVELCKLQDDATIRILSGQELKLQMEGYHMSKTFAEMEDMYKEVVQRFNRIELQEWKAEGAMIELTKQVGELAKQVMIKERYYALEGDVPDVDERLGDEMADVVAQIMRLADHYKIDLESAFIKARENEDRYLRSRGV